jgi:hypothetical protein
LTGYEVHGLAGALETSLEINDFKSMAALMMAAVLTIWKLHTRAAAERLSQSLALKARF